MPRLVLSRAPDGHRAETSLIPVSKRSEDFMLQLVRLREDVLDYLEVIGHSRRQYVDAVKQPDNRGIMPRARIDGRMLAAELSSNRV
ncbi:MAG: hypothetical protein CM15mP70_16680 [Pelagibacteraceae bacterium]|nr:MAG: hypothetical protein CM15mP70_16680 [Pelagibacteraceae bacterium]